MRGSKGSLSPVKITCVKYSLGVFPSIGKRFLEIFWVEHFYVLGFSDSLGLNVS